MKFRFGSGIRLAYSRYEPVLNLHVFSERSSCVNLHGIYLSGVKL